jgi:hypothetical protein
MTQAHDAAFWKDRQIRSGKYSILRFMPDFERGETFNIGIVVWDDENHQLRLDDEAILRVNRENPQLPKDALLCYEDSLRRHLTPDGRVRGEDIDKRIMELVHDPRWFPLQVTEPLYTAIPEGVEDPLEWTLNTLLLGMITPRKRSGGGGISLTTMFTRHLNPLIAQGAVYKNHPLNGKRSDTPWMIQFFANSGANVALDTLQLALKKADDIRERSIVEAYKVEDVLASQDIKYVVYCRTSPDEKLKEYNDSALSLIKKSGAIVTTDMQRALAEVRDAAIARHGGLQARMF